MAAAKSFITLLLFISLLSLASCLSSASETKFKANVTVSNGLAFGFYAFVCPQVEILVRNYLLQVFNRDVGQAAGILRLHAHDCFVQGCDGSILLDRSVERTELPNLSLRPESIQVIDTLRQIVHSQCGPVVSCSDLLTLAARDSVFFTSGFDYAVPLGRRDGVVFPRPGQTFEDLIAPNAKTTEVLTKYARKGLNLVDAVALSGAHSIGIAHCSSFSERIFPNRDPTMEISFFNSLRQVCPAPNANGIASLDIRSPFRFDNFYFIDLMNRQGLFTSDQDLFEDLRTRPTVITFAASQPLFFSSFAVAMTKMGTVEVLTGAQGEIRARCNVRNSDVNDLEPVVEKDIALSSAM